MISKTTVLYGEYDIGIDEKNRLLIPSEVRRSLDPERDGEAFFIVIGKNLRPWLYPERGYESLVAKLETQMTPGDDSLAFDQMHFSMASRIDLDKQFRVLIPEATRKNTNLSRDITMIGVRDHLELWNREDWTIRKQQLFARRIELAEKQRLADEKAASLISQ